MLQFKKFCFLVAISRITTSLAQKPAYSENRTRHDGKTVLLGGLFPLSENVNSECGLVRASAVAAMEAMVFTIHQINANKTLLPGITLTYDIRDTCSIANTALEQSLSYVYDQSSKETNKLAISGIVGPGFFSHVSQAVASFFRLFRVPQISYGSTASILSDRVQYDYFFRTVPPDSHLAQAMADMIIHFRCTYIIALHSDDNYGINGLDHILKTIQKKGNTTCLAVKIAIPVGISSSAMFDDIVNEMNKPWVRNASVAFMFGYRQQTTGVLAAIERLLIRDPNTPLQSLLWVGCDALRVDSSYHYLLHGMIQMQYSVKKSAEFQDHFSTLTESAATNAELFREYLEDVSNCTFSQGTCTYDSPVNYRQEVEISSIIDAVYAFAHAIDGVIRVHCNTSVLCENVLCRHSAGIAVNGMLIRDYLVQNISFPGLSSERVTFDSNGNDESYFRVENLQQKPDGTYHYVPIGTWKPHLSLEISGKVEFKGNKSAAMSHCSKPCQSGYYRVPVSGQSKCCWTCQECPGKNTISEGIMCSKCKLGYFPNAKRSKCIKNNITYLTWSMSITLILLICTCFGILATILIIVTYVVFNKDPIIKASSRELSGVLLFGLLLCYCVPFLYAIKPSPPLCAVRRFATGFSFAICFSALLVKTNRLHRIFNRPTAQRSMAPKCISPVSQMFIVCVLLSVQIVIASLWLAIEHPDIMYISSGQITEIHCKESSDIGLFVSLSYNLLLLILSTYFAFLARKIPENFNEAKFINITLYTIIIIWLAFIPTYFATAKLSLVYQSISLMTVIICNATTTISCLFAPKMFFLIKEKIRVPQKHDNNAAIFNGITTKPTVTSSKDSSNSLESYSQNNE